MIAIELSEPNRGGYRHGSEIAGTVRWHLSHAPQRVEVRLAWMTKGKGDTDKETVEIIQIPANGPSGAAPFQVSLPYGPSSFSGHLISVCWFLEAVAEPNIEAAQKDLVISPTGLEVLVAHKK